MRDYLAQVEYMYEIVTLLMTCSFINMSMHLLCKFKQVYFFDFLFIMQLPGTRSKLVTF